MSSLAKDSRCLRPRVVELKEASKTKASKVLVKRRTADMEVVSERTCKERAEHMDWIAQLKGDLLELKDRLEIFRTLRLCC